MWNAASTNTRPRALSRAVQLAILAAVILVPATAALESSTPGPVRISAEADARVVESRPNENFGRYYLRVKGGGEPVDSAAGRPSEPPMTTN